MPEVAELDNLETSETFTLVVPAGVEERRLDLWLARQLPELTRSRIQALAKQGYLADAEGRPPAKLSLAPNPGSTWILTLPPAEPTEIVPEDIALDILYEDEDLLVVNKPAGLVVHPACGHSHGTLVNAVLFHCPSLGGIGGEKRPGIVHRLDRDTSGVMVVAKTERAHQELVRTFASHTLSKHYVAIVHGCPPETGTLDTRIGRSPFSRQKMAVLRSGGKQAITHWKREAILPEGVSRVACEIETGRTHQIRVHLASLGTPIVGDALYGKPALDKRLKTCPHRQLLHARRLQLPHPVFHQLMTFEAPFPEDFTPYL